MSALLVLEDGRYFRGESFGAVGEAFGEVVFATGMTGYQETLTDPSYHRQIVLQTAPHIGNTGANDEDMESDRMWAAGYIVRNQSRFVSSWRATRSLNDELHKYGVIGISQLDTRALTRHLRERGVMRAGISTVDNDPESVRERVLASPSMVGSDLAGEVSTQDPYVVSPRGSERFRVTAIDLGIKRMTPHRLAERGIRVEVLPAGSTVDDVLASRPDGLFFSNGPGDPATAEHAVALVHSAMSRRIPVFGICFGHQILGRALGFGTYKLRYGHRGINQPVQDRLTQRVDVTAHNHGFAVAADTEAITHTPFGRVEVSHVCLNDGVVEGLRCLDAPAFGVQYHPEAAAGPHDAGYLFDKFAALLGGGV